MMTHFEPYCLTVRLKRKKTGKKYAVFFYIHYSPTYVMSCQHEEYHRAYTLEKLL